MFFSFFLDIFAISLKISVKHQSGDREGGFSSLPLSFKTQTSMNITKEQVEELLPQTVKDTDVLSDDAKNMFAVLLNSLQVSKGAEETGVLIKNTDALSRYVGWRFERMMKAVRELEMHGLITRIPGKLRTNGEPSIATQFIFNWEVIDKPIVRKTHDDLFAKFRHMKTSGNTRGKCNSNNNGNINDNSNFKLNLNDNTNENSNLNHNEKDILKEEYEQKRFMVEEHIRQEAKGKSYTEITRLTIPTYNWIESAFPGDSDRLKKLADNLLHKIKREGLVTEPSTTPGIDEYQAGLPF